MESRSYMFSTVKKKSTLLENKGIEYCFIHSGFLGKIHQHHACVSSRKNVLQSSTPTWTASRKTQERLKTATNIDRNCSNVESLVSKRPMPIPITPID
jgi:hypothetical protein